MAKSMSDKEKALSEAHAQWMNVTATAVSQVHNTDGYKGHAQTALLRPQYPQGSKVSK